jgi:hypothetical protein
MTYRGGTSFRDVAEVNSVYYDFLPMTQAARKSFWVQTKFPPEGLEIGMPVTLKSRDPDLRFPQEQFIVVDVVGIRIVLQPAEQIFNPSALNPFALTAFRAEQNKGSNFAARDVAPFSSTQETWFPWNRDWHFGHSTKYHVHYRAKPRPWFDFGSGEPVAYLYW